MNIINRAIIFLLIVGITACATGQSIMTAANDEDQDIGLGGTGLLADNGSGLGGTGILGEITGYGSIFVNGIEVEYHRGTAFTVDGETAAYQQLEIGDVVEVLTTDASKHTQALMINLRHEVVGKVESVDPQTASFTVQGQRVIQAADEKQLPATGETVAVSGFRIDDHSIQATRVKPAQTDQRLLRIDTRLPYNDQVARWSVQAYVQDEHISFQLNGSPQVLSVQKKAEATGSRPATRILQLKKSASGQLEIDKEFEPVGMPRGRQTIKPVQRPGGFMINKPVPGSMPRSLPGSSPGSMHLNIRSERYIGRQ